MAVHPNYNNPRVITLTGITGTPTRCFGCGEAIDHHDSRQVLVTGLRDRVDVIAVSHVDHYGEDAATVTGCADGLRARWIEELAHCGAGLLLYRRNHRRFFLGECPVPCGTGVELLGADGHWQHGRFEITGGTRRPAPLFCFRVPPSAALRLRPPADVTANTGPA
jgi:hypothetical protein